MPFFIDCLKTKGDGNFAFELSFIKIEIGGRSSTLQAISFRSDRR